MMSKTLGIVFSNMHDSMMGKITEHRTMASVPFGGRYRLVDFVLSNMINSGVKDVGIITKSNFQSLMDHLGTGKEWDLSRKKGGLTILPPYGRQESVYYRGRLEALGMTRQTPVSVLNRKGKGILIIKLRGTRFALGYNITKNIEVKEDGENER